MYLYWLFQCKGSLAGENHLRINLVDNSVNLRMQFFFAEILVRFLWNHKKSPLIIFLFNFMVYLTTSSAVLTQNRCTVCDRFQRTGSNFVLATRAHEWSSRFSWTSSGTNFPIFSIPIRCRNIPIAFYNPCIAQWAKTRKKV